MIVVVMEGGDESQAGVAHALQRLVERQFTLSDHLGLGQIDAALGDSLADRRGLRAAGNPDVDHVGVHVLGALQERSEVQVRYRITRRADDLTAGLLERALERLLAVMAGAEIRDERVGLAGAALVGPGAERLVDLRHRERGAHHVVGLRRDDRGCGVHVDHELLGLRRHVGGRKRVRRQIEADDHVDLVAHDRLLRQTLGRVRRDAAVVLADEFDLLAGNRVAVLLHVELDAVVDLGARIGELSGKGHDHADLDAALSQGGCGGKQRGGEAGKPGRCASHGSLRNHLFGSVVDAIYPVPGANCNGRAGDSIGDPGRKSIRPGVALQRRHCVRRDAGSIPTPPVPPCAAERRGAFGRAPDRSLVLTACRSNSADCWLLISSGPVDCRDC